jgi:photosystem II stability/assembly factor-like uncharacterized protein
MSKFSTLVLFLLLLLLTACGPLDIRVEPIATPTPLPASTPTPLPASTPSPVPTSAPTQLPFIATPTLVASLTLPPPAPDLHLKAGSPVRIVQTHMLTALAGWAVGESDQDLIQHVLFTSDGGRTWRDTTPQSVLASTTEGGLSVDAYFASTDAAWALYAPRKLGGPDGQMPLYVWHTVDGGKTWLPSQALDLSDLQNGIVEYQVPSNLGFLDAQHGWVMLHVGAGMSHDYFAAFTSEDGGLKWKRILDPDTKVPIMSCEKSGIAFTSPASGWITGNCPGLMPKLFIFHTADGGLTWAAVDLPAPPGKPTNYFASGVACGINAIDYSSARVLALTLTCTNYNNNTAQSWLYASTDGGQSWARRMLPALYTSIDLLGSDEGFLVGSINSGPDATGAVYHTSNGGADWLLTTSTGWTGLPDFIDSQNGWVVATHSQVTAFVHTIDGGRTWVELKPIIGS